MTTPVPEPGARPATGAAAEWPRDTDPLSRRIRLLALAAALAIGGLAYLLRDGLGERGIGPLGALVMIAVSLALSSAPRRIDLRTVGWGIALQLLLALFILRFEIGGVRPGYALFSAIGAVVRQFLAFTDLGAQFVFGPLADPAKMDPVFGAGNGFVFAFRALPTIIFVSSFFTILYYYGVLQFIVKIMARGMMYLMRTSGAESLSAAANVFMGQTEAPLIVRPYVEPMTRSELLALMVGGMATISGGVMAVYISLGADPVALLTASAMAAPCSLYITKIVLPELGEPVTRGVIRMEVPRTDVNVIDAASRGASDGTVLAINVAAMLIAFLALIAMFDYMLGFIHWGAAAPDAAPGWLSAGQLHLGQFQGRSGHQACTVLSLSRIFAVVFAPLAFLMGVPGPDIGGVADLLGTKLVANEFVAYVKLTGPYRAVLSARATEIITIALCGFANFASIGIQLGGIGAMAPSRRSDLSRLGMRALYCGFVATMINAAIAATLLP